MSSEIRTANEMKKILDELVIQLKEIRSDKDINIQFFINVIEKIMETEAVWVVRKEENLWKCDAKSGIPPNLRNSKLTKIFDDILLDENAPIFVCDTKEECTDKLGIPLFENIAIIRFDWAFITTDKRILIICGKKSRIDGAVDLPYHITQILQFVSQFFTLATGSIASVKGTYRSKRNAWKNSLYSGSRSSVYNRSYELIEELEKNKNFGKSTTRDEAVACFLETGLWKAITPSVKLFHQQPRNLLTLSKPDDSHFTDMAELRRKIWAKANKQILEPLIKFQEGDTRSLSLYDLTGELKSTIKNINRSLDAQPEDSDLNKRFFPLECPNISSSPYSPQMVNRLWEFSNHCGKSIDILRTRLFALNNLASVCRDALDNKILEVCDDLFFGDSDSTWQSLPESLEDLLASYLGVWKADNEELVVSSDWLALWFGWEFVRNETLWNNLKTRKTLASRALYYSQFSSYYLYLIHVIRFWGHPTFFQFSEIRDGYAGFLDAGIFLLTEYAQEESGLLPDVPLYRVLSESWNSEAILYVIREGYRDHLHHVWNVCLLGMVLLQAGFLNALAPQNDRDVKKIYRNWIVAGLLHDLGYALDISRHLVPRLKLLRSFPGLNDFLETLLAGAKEAEKKLCNTMHPFIRDWFDFAETGDRLDHGLVSAMLAAFARQTGNSDGIASHDLPKTVRQWVDDMKEALSAIARHNLSTIPINPKENPLSLLLLLCDHIQEWDRPRPEPQGAGRAISMLWLRPRSAPPKAANIVRHLQANLSWGKNEGVKLNDPNLLKLVLKYSDASLETFEPAIIWCQNTRDFAKVDYSKLETGFEILFEACQPNSEEMKRHPGLCEMDLLEDFLREDSESFGLIPWILDARNNGKWFKYRKEELMPEECFSWTLSKNASEYRIYLPEGLYFRFIEWKRRKLQAARIRRTDV